VIPQKSWRKTALHLFSASVLIFLACKGLSAAPKLDVGTEYRIRGVAFRNPTYGSELPLGTQKTINQSYYSHRARIYLKGRLDPGIEIASTIQAIGIAGSSAPVLNRYPDEDFSPFIENVYIQVNEMWDWPLSVTLGRQPYVWGSGLLIADDGLGFDALRLDAGPFWGIRTKFFTAKDRDRIGGSNDSDLHMAGIEYTWGIHNIKLGWVLEQNKSGSPYTNLTSTVPINADSLSRSFIDLQVTGNLKRGAFYKAEFALQQGTAKLPGQNIKLSGSALTFEGGFDFVHPRYRRMVLAFVFMQGSGDDPNTSDKDEKFNPSFGHKFDGLERDGLGEFFAATPYSFFNEDKIVVSNQIGGVLQTFPYTALFSGLRTFGFRGTANPIEGFVAGLEFYLYTARQLPDIRFGSPTTITDNALGRELIISASYTYSRRIKFSLRWGKFFPSATLNDKGSSRLIFEAAGRF